jgi:hypothetical protein
MIFYTDIGCEMNNTFFIFLPSDTKNGGGGGGGGVKSDNVNRPNKFKIILPKKLTFESSGTWLCGLHSISYPHRLKFNILYYIII